MEGKSKDTVLGDVRILDLSRFLAGPICGMLLADMGAEVLRIEPPGGGIDRRWGILGPDGETLTYKILGRNKKSVTLNLLSEKGMLIFKELVKQSDVVLHNFPPGTNLSSELSYEKLRDINNRITVAVISGYGQNGPDANQACFDFVSQARAGAMTLNGFPGDPPLKTTVPYVDCSSGISTALGIVLSLYNREKTGRGQLVDVALFDIASFITQSLGALMYYKIYGEVRKQFGNFGFASFMSCLKTEDGHAMVVASSDPIWKRFMEAIDKEELGTNPTFRNDMSRSLNAHLIDPIVQKWAAARTTDEVISIMQSARVPCAKVNTVDELLIDPQSIAREMVVNVEFPDLGEVPIPGLPIKLSLTPGHISGLAPGVGEHNQDIYCDLLKFDSAELEKLRQEKVI